LPGQAQVAQGSVQQQQANWSNSNWSSQPYSSVQQQGQVGNQPQGVGQSQWSVGIQQQYQDRIQRHQQQIQLLQQQGQVDNQRQIELHKQRIQQLQQEQQQYQQEQQQHQQEQQQHQQQIQQANWFWTRGVLPPQQQGQTQGQYRFPIPPYKSKPQDEKTPLQGAGAGGDLGGVGGVPKSTVAVPKSQSGVQPPVTQGTFPPPPDAEDLLSNLDDLPVADVPPLIVEQQHVDTGNNNFDVGYGGGSTGGAPLPVVVIQPPPLLPGQPPVTQGTFPSPPVAEDLLSNLDDLPVADVPPGTPPPQHEDAGNNNLNLGDQQKFIVNLTETVGVVMKEVESCALKKASQEMYEERGEVQEEQEMAMEVAAKEALKVRISQAEEELIAKLMDEDEILKTTVLEKSPKLAQDILARNFTQYYEVAREADKMITPPPPLLEAKERWDMWHAYHEIDAAVSWIINERVKKNVMEQLLGTDWEKEMERNTSTFSNNLEMVQAVVADRMINRKGQALMVALEKNVKNTMIGLKKVAFEAMKNVK
ncbi:MAG: hypothetical protein LE180_05125, partial [Endomicrobium sp.]|nr:hypothetical protein [Endomicrobium sp.]